MPGCPAGQRFSTGSRATRNFATYTLAPRDARFEAIDQPIKPSMKDHYKPVSNRSLSALGTIIIVAESVGWRLRSGWGVGDRGKLRINPMQGIPPRLII
jgi:hypothetical protein